ncbi:uncharacterized protein SAPINGB_P001768 [Magnusiomyces paraingens]|uniref:Purine-cytosine permease n=1 Tax=Magnusiomyces paraingens TaxID=2606893 RepID=A0A5E8BBD9_9ASCO|nr:uncharacterized protein SAPINGB_P001768 [Saprochaete ingens]VVT48416.1 unnamed protein product [Saprochaete ingens]
MNEEDYEKNITKTVDVEAAELSSNDFGTYEEQHKEKTWIEKIKNSWIFKSVEVRGIERIPEDEQIDTSIWNTASMWFGANMVVATVAIGVLGITVFGLDFWSAFLTIIFFNLLGSQPVALFSTFGPVFGLRQMVLTRFWFGRYVAIVPAIINIVACVGWTAVNTIVSAQLLHSVNNGALPPWAGVLIIAGITFGISFFGYHIVHQFEKWSWVPNVIIFLILAIRMGKSHKFTYGDMVGGRTTAGNVLSFGATVYGFSTGWTSYAADYTVYMPKNTSRWKVYVSVVLGLNTPLNIAMILGAACATGTLTTESWQTNYENNSVGGLFYSILVENSLHGFGQFCIVILALSTVSNNIPNLYSLGLSAQSIWDKFILVPRFAWTFIGAAVSIAIAIPAYYDFNNVMEDFMNLIGYWLAIYTAIGISEHFFYKKGFIGYNPDDYNNAKRLPPGIAAGFSFACGCAGVAIGMNQIWWTGPLAKLIGTYGGDIGFELAFGFAFIAFNITRPLELRYFNR